MPEVIPEVMPVASMEGAAKFEVDGERVGKPVGKPVAESIVPASIGSADIEGPPSMVPERVEVINRINNQRPITIRKYMKMVIWSNSHPSSVRFKKNEHWASTTVRTNLLFTQNVPSSKKVGGQSV